MALRIARFAALATLAATAACGGGGSAGSGGGGSAGAGDPPPVSTSPGDGPARFVDPFIGTGDAESPDPVNGGKGGSTYPGATLPFGMVQWSPDTPNGDPAGYHFGDGQLTGFSLTHLSGAGCAAKRDFPVYPVTGAWDPSVEPQDTFKHEHEIASPGFYEVTLDSGIEVDLTATRRTGLARFTFPADPSARVLVSGGWLGDLITAIDFSATVAKDGTITGHRTDTFFCGTGESYDVYFAARFDRPFHEHGTWSDGDANPGADSVSGARSGVYVTFDTRERHVVHMKVGLSYVSEENALANLEAESRGWDFDATHQAAIDTWNGYLGRAAVEGGSDDQQRAFNTALYHAFLQPGAASDVNGDYIGFDKQKKSTGGAYTRYADFSGWDIYRSWIPLVSVLAPREAGDMMRSLVESGTECGALPKWSLESTETGVMVGDPADAILSSAHAFGAQNFDAQAALALMKKGATDPAAACNGRLVRKGLADYLALHYCPADGKDAPDGPSATTLEYVVADFAIAQLAGALGDSATQQAFLDRGQYWKNVFDPAVVFDGLTGYMQPRLAQDQNGMPAFVETSAASFGGLVEGSAAQYTFMVPHDVPGLSAALGGDDVLVARLSAHFGQLNAGVSSPYFYMGNEPGFGTPWAYVFAGAPWRTQDVVQKILAQVFTTAPGGLPGNDDLGALSSWQAWAMMGLYPAVPGVGGFVLTTPVFTRTTLTLGGGKTLVITRSGDGPYVQGATLNGKPLTRAWVGWDEIVMGGSLDFTVGPAANTSWGASAADRPPAFYP